MSIYDYVIENRQGESVSLSQYQGKVLLVVNTATACGFTPQYKDLQEMYRSFHGKGLEIIDIPCNQFAHQTPGNDEEMNFVRGSTTQVSINFISQMSMENRNCHYLHS